MGAADAANPAAAAAGPKPVVGKVIETMNSGGYTYLQVADGDRKVWVASPQVKVAVGEEVRVENYMEMKDFTSKTLNRTFDSILFAQQVRSGSEPTPAKPALPAGHPEITSGQPGLPAGHPQISPGKAALPAGHPETSPETPAMPSGHPAVGAAPAEALKVEKGAVKKPWWGYTVEECFAKQESLANKTVKVRGVVVKFNPLILGKNWLHIQDGTGQEGKNDLTVTTQDTVQVGDVVLVKGTIKYNKDFGAGYSYTAIVEDATVKREDRYQP